MDSLLLSEIHEQPAAIQRLLDREAGRVAEIGRALAGRDIQYAVIAARGTSDNAARYGQYLLGARNRLTVALAAPSLFSLYERPPRLDGALVIGISQSGQSPDIVQVLREARAQGSPTVAITNDAASPLAAAAEHVIELHAGPERSIAATKTYTTQLCAVALLSAALAGDPAQSDRLTSTPGLMEQALAAGEAAQAAGARLAGSDRCAAIGRGFNYATAFETALKIKELAYVETEPYSSADFKHGPIALVEPGFPVIVVAVGETVRGELAELGDNLRERGATVAVLGDDEALRRPEDAWIPVPPGIPEWLTPLVAIVPGQLLAYHLSRARGHDPDAPRTLRKVTLTK